MKEHRGLGRSSKKLKILKIDDCETAFLKLSAFHGGFMVGVWYDLGGRSL